jgi:hypothetical protein
MAISMKAVTDVIEVVMRGAKHAVKYINPLETVKATFQGKRKGRTRIQTIVLTAGTPNYHERKFIKRAVRTGQRFPMTRMKF